MRPLLSLPPNYKAGLLYLTVIIVLLITLGLMLDPGPNPAVN